MDPHQSDEPLLDACLEEALGNAAPPDLTAEILRALGERQREAAGQPAAGEPVAAPPVQRPRQGDWTGPAPRRQRSRNGRRQAWHAAIGWSVAAAGLLLAVLAGLALRQPAARPGAGTLGKHPSPPAAPHAPRNPLQDPPGVPGEASRPMVAQDDRPAAQDGIPGNGRPGGGTPSTPSTPNSEPQLADRPARPDRPQPIDLTPASPSAGEPALAGGNGQSPRRPVADPAVVAEANRILQVAWRDEGIRSETVDASQWCRRVYLRVLGRIPTVAELEAFLAEDGALADRAAALLRQLQYGELYQEEYAGHWARYWTNVLVGRRGGTGDALADREALEQFLRRMIHQQVGVDQWVAELITARGSSDAGSDDYNPATHFLLAHLAPKSREHVQATAQIARVFHGHQLRCVQCHDHPATDRWNQRHFWELNAFLRQLTLQRDGDVVRLTDTDYAGEDGDLDDAPVYYEQLNGYRRAAYPAFPGAPPVSPTGRVSQVHRRAVLARAIIDSPQLSRAIVNRLWGYFLGYGFTNPVDDMGPHRPVAQPDLLAHLAGRFEDSGYQFDQLVRWIALSDSFSRSSELTPGTLADAPERGGTPLFSRYYVRQLQPEAVYDSLVLVAEARRKADPQRAQWLGQFAQPMGTDENEEADTFRGDIRQSLILMNGPLMKRATSPENSQGLLRSVLQSKMKWEEKVAHLFLASVARRPTAREQSLIAKMRGGTGQTPRAARRDQEVLESVWWALLNSNEFILDH